MTRYGGSAWKLGEYFTSYVRSGHFLLAVPRHADQVLEVAVLATGEVHRATATRSVLPAGDELFVVVESAPTTVQRVALPDLTPRARFEVGAGAIALAASDTWLVAGATEPPRLLVVALPDGAPRGIDLPAPPRRATISPDGTRAAVVLESGKAAPILIVELASGRVLATLKGARAPAPPPAWCGAARDLVAVASGKTVVAWPATGGKARTLDRGTKRALGVVGCVEQGERAGRLVVVEHEQRITSIDADAGRIDWSAPHYGPAFVSGDRIVSCRFKHVRELDPATGAELGVVEAPDFLEALVPLEDGALAITKTATPARLPRAATAWPRAPIEGHVDDVIATAFDGALFATSGRDARVCVWRRGESTPFAAFQEAETSIAQATTALHLDARASRLWTGLDHSVQRFELGGGARIESPRLKRRPTRLLPLAGAPFVVVATQASRGSYGALYLLDASTLAIVREVRLGWNCERIDELDGGARVRLRSALADQTFDVPTLAELEEKQRPSRDYSRTHVLTPDERVLVSWRWSGNPAVWTMYATDLVSGASLYDGLVVPDIVAGELSPGGERVAMVEPTGLALRDVRTAEVTSRHALPIDDATGVAWFPDASAVLVWNHHGDLHDVALA